MVSIHGLLGYLTVCVAGLGFLLALGALFSRSQLLSKLMFIAYVLCALFQVPALVTGVIANAAHVDTAAAVAPFNFFLAASFFTATGMLAAWRGVNPNVVWEPDQWLVYQAAALGNSMLGIALIWLGRLSQPNH